MDLKVGDKGDSPGLAEIAVELWPEGANSVKRGDEELFMEVAQRNGISRSAVDEALASVPIAAEAAVMFRRPSGAKRARPLPTARRTRSLRTRVRAFIHYLNGRRLVERRPFAEFSIQYFEAHVPHKGTIAVSTATTRERTSSFDLTVGGSGAGRTRTLSITETASGTTERVCSYFDIVVQARACRYRYRTDEIWELEEITCTGEQDPGSFMCILFDWTG